ncbi:nucleotidyltransferase family protein [Pseudobutyrivibrio xylanivorans]|nr:nucleotidyltransferase domain-containing protein [Pseudobutyrivibrio xylanivorans]
MNIYTIDEIKRIVKPIAESYGIQEIYLFGSYAKGTATEESDLDFLVFGGEGFKLSMVYALGEDLREAFHKEIDIFEIHEVNVDSDFYREVLQERKLVA